MSSLFGNLLSGATAGLLNQPLTKTSSSTGTSSNLTSNTGTSTTQQNLTPFQQQLQGPLFNLVNTAMTNPASLTAPAENTAVNQVNDNFSGLAKSLRSQFLQTGGGTSGKYGLATASGDISRLSNISGVQNSFANTNATLPLNVASSLAMPLLAQNFGSTSTGTSNGSNNGTTANNGSDTITEGNPFQTGLAGFFNSLGSPTPNAAGSGPSGPSTLSQIIQLFGGL